MNNRTCIWIAIIAFVWMHQFVFQISDTRFPELMREDRINYVIYHGKSSLPVVSEMNQVLGPDDRVYGLWLEDMRYYADFQMVGSIYGYGSHTVVGTGMNLAEYVRSLDCDYLMVDYRKLASTAPYMKDGEAVEIPESAEWWDEEFEECEEFQVEGFRHVRVWQLVKRFGNPDLIIDEGMTDAKQ